MLAVAAGTRSGVLDPMPYMGVPADAGQIPVNHALAPGVPVETMEHKAIRNEYCPVGAGPVPALVPVCLPFWV